MQIEQEGEFLYLYSGREIQCKEADKDNVGREDPFSKVQCIPIKSITGVDIDHKEFTITLHIKGHTYPIFCSFGQRNCHKLNCFANFIDVLKETLHLSANKIWDLQRRNAETALSVQRKDETEIE